MHSRQPRNLILRRSGNGVKACTADLARIDLAGVAKYRAQWTEPSRRRRDKAGSGPQGRGAARLGLGWGGERDTCLVPLADPCPVGVRWKWFDCVVRRRGAEGVAGVLF